MSKYLAIVCLGLMFLTPGMVLAQADESVDLEAVIKQVEAELVEWRDKAVTQQHMIEAERMERLATLEYMTRHWESVEKSLARARQAQVKLADELTKQKARLLEIEAERDDYLGVLKVKATELAERLGATMVGYEQAELRQRADELVENLAKAEPDLVQATAELFSLANEELRSGSEVNWFRGEVIASGGEVVEANILRVGEIVNFGMLKNGETGMLIRSEDGRSWRVISERLGFFQRQRVKDFVDQAFEADTEIMALPLDVTGGLAIAERVFSRSFWEYVKSGGIVMIPLVAIAILGLLLAIERLVTLTRVRLKTGKLTREIDKLCQEGKYAEAESLCGSSSSPVCRVLKAGLAHRTSSKDVLENALEEAILHELPSLERFVSLLAVLGVIAPFLGLLGTVTGMIGTFNVITLYGTGDASLLSGGISEALITTQAGLVIAIPLLLLHNLISGKVSRLTEEMEARATRLVNILSVSNRSGETN